MVRVSGGWGKPCIDEGGLVFILCQENHPIWECVKCGEMEGSLERGDSDRSLLGDSKVTHTSSSMAMVKDPSEGFSSLVRSIQYASNMEEADYLLGSPLLNSEVLDVDMTRPRRRLVLVDHIDGSLVINVERSRVFFWEA